MTPGQARAFLAVALKGSFSKAARSLNVSQPTVTNQIQQIERQHQVELFYRGARGATLTPAGEALVPFIQRMFSNFEEAGAFLDGLRGVQRGHLRIGSYGPYDVIKLVARYSVRFPSVSIFVDFANSQSLTRKAGQLRTGRRGSRPRRNRGKIFFASVQRSFARGHRATKAAMDGPVVGPGCQNLAGKRSCAASRVRRRARHTIDSCVTAGFRRDASLNLPAGRASSTRWPKESASPRYLTRAFCRVTVS